MTPEIVQTAATLVAQYGDDAAVIAVLRAAEYAAAGDEAACDHWEAVASYLEDPKSNTSKPT